MVENKSFLPVFPLSNSKKSNPTSSHPMSSSPFLQKLALSVALTSLLWDIFYAPFMVSFLALSTQMPFSLTTILASNGGLLIVLDQLVFEPAFLASHLQLDMALCALAIFGYFRREKYFFLPFVIVKAVIVVVSVISFIITAILCILGSERVQFLKKEEISKVWLFLAMLFGILCNFLLGAAMLFGYLRFSDGKTAVPESANANVCHQNYTSVASPSPHSQQMGLQGKTYQVGEA